MPSLEQWLLRPTECRHCHRDIVADPTEGWVDPEAAGDDEVWRVTCDQHDTFTAEHEPESDPYLPDRPFEG